MTPRTQITLSTSINIAELKSCLDIDFLYLNDEYHTILDLKTQKVALVGKEYKGSSELRFFETEYNEEELKNFLTHIPGYNLTTPPVRKDLPFSYKTAELMTLCFSSLVFRMENINASIFEPIKSSLNDLKNIIHNYPQIKNFIGNTLFTQIKSSSEFYEPLRALTRYKDYRTNEYLILTIMKILPKRFEALQNFIYEKVARKNESTAAERGLERAKNIYHFELPTPIALDLQFSFQESLELNATYTVSSRWGDETLSLYTYEAKSNYECIIDNRENKIALKLITDPKLNKVIAIETHLKAEKFAEFLNKFSSDIYSARALKELKTDELKPAEESLDEMGNYLYRYVNLVATEIPNSILFNIVLNKFYEYLKDDKNSEFGLSNHLLAGLIFSLQKKQTMAKDKIIALCHHFKNYEHRNKPQLEKELQSLLQGAVGNVDNLIRSALMETSIGHRNMTNIVLSFFPPINDYFERYQAIQRKTFYIGEEYKEKKGDLDNISIINSVSQILKSCGIDEFSFVGAKVGPDRRNGAWDFVAQIQNILDQPAARGKKYIYFSLPTNKGQHSTPVVIDNIRKKIYCLDPKLETLEFAEEKGMVNTQQEAIRYLEAATASVTPIKEFKIVSPPKGTAITAIQGSNLLGEIDMLNCGIYSVMIIVGIILEIEKPQHRSSAHIKINVETGKGISNKSAYLHEFIVIIKLALEDYANQLSMGHREPASLSVQLDSAPAKLVSTNS